MRKVYDLMKIKKYSNQVIKQNYFKSQKDEIQEEYNKMQKKQRIELYKINFNINIKTKKNIGFVNTKAGK